MKRLKQTKISTTSRLGKGDKSGFYGLSSNIGLVWMVGIGFMDLRVGPATCMIEMDQNGCGCVSTETCFDN